VLEDFVKLVEENVAGLEIKSKKYCKVIRRVTRITCSLYADPHVHGFNNKNYDAQTEGDWVLYKGENLSANYRGKRNGGWVAAIKFGVRLFGNRIYSVGFKFDTLKINGHIKRIKEGINKISKRGSIIKAGNKITFSTNDGEEVDFITFGSFFNVYVRSNVEKVSGICSQQFIKSKFFKHIHQGKIIKFRHKKCPKKNEIP